MDDHPATQLRPMGIGDILDATFRLYRQHFVSFLAIIMVAYVPYAILLAVVGNITPEPAAAGPFAPESSIAMILLQIIPTLVYALLVLPLCEAAMLHNISSAYLGDDLSALASYRRALPRLLPLILTRILVALAIMFGFILLVVPGIIFGLWFSLTTSVVVLEHKSGTRAMGRSRDLIRGNLGKTFLLGLVVGILGIVTTVVFELATSYLPFPHETLRIFTSTILQALTLPILIAPYVLLYYDMRIRKEGFDLEALAATLDGAEQA